MIRFRRPSVKYVQELFGDTMKAQRLERHSSEEGGDKSAMLWRLCAEEARRKDPSRRLNRKCEVQDKTCKCIDESSVSTAHKVYSSALISMRYDDHPASVMKSPPRVAMRGKIAIISAEQKKEKRKKKQEEKRR